jgi:hypothetical protein
LYSTLRQALRVLSLSASKSRLDFDVPPTFALLEGLEAPDAALELLGAAEEEAAAGAEAEGVPGVAGEAPLDVAGVPVYCHQSRAPSALSACTHFSSP